MNTKEKIRGSSLILTIVLILLFVCIGVAINNEPTVNAENVASTELCQVPLTYLISNDEATITGYDEWLMSSFTVEQKSNLTIVIPATIGDIPVVGIEEYAFDQTPIFDREVYNFKSIDLSGATNLKFIGAWAFVGCRNGNNQLIFPDSLTTIGEGGFKDTNIIIHNLPKSLEYIGDEAFKGCHISDIIVIPDSVTYIGDYAFADMDPRVDAVYLPKSADTYYGTEILKNMSGLKGDTIVVAQTKEQYDIFSSPGHNLSNYSLTYETTVTFDTQNGDKIEQTKLFGYPLNYGRLTNIDGYWLWEEDWRYVLPTASRTEHKFLGWTISADATPIDMTTIVDDAATYYAQYEVLTFKSDFIQGKGYVILGYTGAYLNSQVGQGTTDIQIEIPETYDDGINGINNVVEIGKEAFYTETSTDYKFVSLDLTKALYLTDIGESAFYGCTDIKSQLLFPDSLITIGKNAFNRCSGFTGSLIIPNSVTTIDWGAFYECSSLDGTLKLPENQNFTKIGEYAFQNCTGLIGELLIPNSVYEISTNAFFNCIGFSKLTLPINENFKQIGDYAFQLCTGLTGVLNIPNSVNKMNVNAFYDCSNLETVYLPNVQGLEWETTSFGNVTCPIVADNKNLYEVYRNNDKMANLNNLTYVSNITFNPGEGALTGNSSQTKLYGYPLAYEKNVDSLVWSYNNEYTLPTAMLSGYIFDGFLVSEGIGLVNRDTIVVDNPIYLASYTKIVLTHIEIVTQPNKVTYKAFETFNKDGIVVKAYFNDKTEKEVTDYIIEYSDGNKSFCFGDTYVTIVYTEDGISARVQLNVSVEKISLSVPTIKGDYVYRGDWQTVTLENFDESTMTLSNNTRLNAGQQEVIVSLKDTNNYKWLDANSEDITLEWIIQTLKVEKPKENNALFTYTGSSQTYRLDSNDAYNITNNVKVDAGSYIVEVTLKNEGDIINYEWVNGGYAPLEFKFIIETQKVEKPEKNDARFTYTGSSQTYHLDSNDAYNITNNVKVDAGNYIVEVTLKNEGGIINYEWVNGGYEPLSFEFIIDRAVAEKPVIANTYTYNGSKITANVVTTEKYTVENNEKIDAGTYYIKVTLNKNYKWSDGQVEDIYLMWTINKCELIVVPAVNNQAKVYVGGYLPELKSNYDNLGIISWDEYDLTVPATDKEFGWTWVPNDTNNYKSVKGIKKFNVLAVTFNGIVIEKSPDKIEYVAFELFDSTGMIVKAKYTDGTEVEVLDYTIKYANGNSFRYGDNIVTVLFEDQGVSNEAKVSIVVTQIILTKPTITGDYDYDGDWQTVTLENFDESTMTLTNNTRLNAGKQEVIVSLKDKVNYKWAGADSEDLKLLWEISCLTIEMPKPDQTSYVYDGTEKTYKIDDSVYYKVIGNKHTNAGKYDVVVSITDKVNIQWEDGSNRDILYEFEIDKATHNISGVTFNDCTVVQNNEIHTLLVNGLPEGITAIYTGTNGYSAEGVKTAGIYEITVTFVVDDKVNYNELTQSMTAILTINNAKLTVEKNDGDKETAIIIVESEKGFSPNITIEGGEDLQNINKRSMQVIYDIRLNNINEMQDLNYPLTIRLFINNEIRNMNNLRVYSVAGDGSLSEIEATVDGDYMVFSVNNLSKFAIVGESMIPIWIIISTAIIWGLNLIGACIILYYNFKKKKATQNEETHKEDNGVSANLFAPILLASGSIPLGLTIAFIIGIVVFIAEIGYLIYMRNKNKNNISADANLDYVDEQSREEFLQSLNELETENLDDVAVSEDDEWAAVWEDEESDYEQTEKDNILRFGGLLYRRSFLAKIIQGSDINKRYYSILKNEFLVYKNTRSSISFTADTIYRKGERLAKFVVAGKTLKLYLAMDPQAIEKNFFVRDESDKKKYEKTPCCMRVKSRRGMFKAIILITRLMSEKAAGKNPKFVEVDYMSMYPYEDADHLIEKGLIKKILIAGGDENVKADVSKIIRDRQDNQNNNTTTGS